MSIYAAGPFAENLLQWLHQLPLETTISFGQPASNKAYQCPLRQTKGRSGRQPGLRSICHCQTATDYAAQSARARVSRAMAWDMRKVAAKSSLGSNQGLLAEQMLRQKVRELRRQQSDSRELDQLIKQA